ncbi:MAG: replication initiator protein [Microviridae sp.]|nr:MAG: replication initiator protein [Microviridae sp.]
MACYKPITCWKPPDGGPVVFRELKDHREIQIACGQCIGCRIRKREAWALRCYCESKMHLHNQFLTLTYDDEHLPSDGSLNYKHFQLFMRYMRRRYGQFRFFMCGEYGEKEGRPHYHALLFGLDIPDLVKSNSVYSEFDTFGSESVRELWGKGDISIGAVNYATARYCAVYTTKKITGELAEEHYMRVSRSTGEITHLVPEFARMSLKPGIGMRWLERYWQDIYLRGNCGYPVDGKLKPIPRYFDIMMKDIAPDVLDQESYRRYLAAVERCEDSTLERLAVREEVAIAKSKFEADRSNYAL